MIDAAGEVQAWADSGAMALTGDADAPPLGPPAGLVPALGALARRLRAAAGALGADLEVDLLALLGERAALAGLTRHGQTSCGGTTRLLRCGEDRWAAVSLARGADRELVPAWLEDDVGEDLWAAIGAALATHGGALVERGAQLGLPVGLLPAGPARSRLPRSTHRTHARLEISGGPVRRRPLADLLVMDLSSLWAGPLCGSLLAAAGARVVKVESTARPDGARLGPRALFDLLNGQKRSVALDLGDPDGVATLRRLLERADLVIEASRPRALEQLGIDARQLLARGPRAWVSITGHGRCGAAGHRVAFGDDAAVEGGLVSWSGGAPRFCADAVADPLTGVVGAVAALEALGAPGRWLLDCSMAGVAAAFAGPTLAAPADLPVAAPRARPAAAAAPASGAHTREVLDEVGLDRR